MSAALSRSELMSRIRSKDTGPELAVRRALHAAGLRFRLHDRKLPGTPDLVLRSRAVVVEVRGCFWHQHFGCPRTAVPKSRRDYWLPKLARNVGRDQANQQALEAAGWHVMVVWECQLPGRLRSLADEVRAASQTAPHPIPSSIRTSANPAPPGSARSNRSPER